MSIRSVFSLGSWLIIFLALSACQAGGRVDNPPLPTVVPAKETPAPTNTIAALSPTPTPSPLPTEPPSETPPDPAATLPPTETPLPPPTDTVAPTPLPTDPLPPTAPPPSPTLVSAGSLESLVITLNPVAGGFTKPLYLSHAGDGSGRLFVVEQPGRILISKDGQVKPDPFLDIVSLVGSDGSEQGLLGLAFHPDYVSNGRFFVYYTDQQGDVVIARYQVSDNPDLADPNSAKILITITEPFANHNGGQLVFGPDGYLYTGLGDGGAANDPHNNGQSLNTLLGKILRFDVDQGEPYGVPANNPFVTTAGARPEIWSYGWRNPWRFSFDRATDEMYIADVGQNQYEEVHFEPAGQAGQNYGWRLMEGLHCFDPAECDPASLKVVLPVAEYDHSEGCSITGGYVYRGQQFPALNGIYFYGDFCSGRLWGLRREADGSWSQAQLLHPGHNISSFGEDEAGELYLVDHRGDILQIGN